MTGQRTVGEFTRYREFIPEWEDFAETITRPAPSYLRVNQYKFSVVQARERFNQDGLPVRRTELANNLFRWTGTDRPAGRSLLHWAGYYYIMDLASLLPVHALSPEPGDTVLDVCAAPGGKSLYLGEMVGDRGTVVANEPVEGRRISLQANVQRFSAPNFVLTGYDGQELPTSETFSSILVDAPCSGEGAERYPRGDFQLEPPDEQTALHQRQYEILRRSYQLLEPGGSLVYSTCSINPYENEAVISRLLNQTNARLEIPSELPNRLNSGITRWDGNQYSKAVRKMRRCYPHHFDCGVMVVAHITRPVEAE